MIRATLGLLLLVVPACSAIVSPSVGRLGGDDAGAGAVDAPASPPDAPGGCGTAVLCAGACVDVATDPRHCGRCDVVCAAGERCVAGLCTGCTGAGCGATSGLGDPSACGSPAVVCGASELCVDGRCECRPPLVRVGTTCVDLATDPANCGAPGNACGGVCRAGSCAPFCGDPLRECDGACVDFLRDAANCGGCGRACDGAQFCVDGDCRDASTATGCTTCPCPACDGARCCVLPRLDVPYCLDADTCPR